MDGAQADHRYSTNALSALARCVGGRGARDAAAGAIPGETGPSADLGGSSKYSNENFED